MTGNRTDRRKTGPRAWSLPPVALVLGLAALLAPAPATAITEIDITRGVVEPLPVAITDLAGSSEVERQLGIDIAQVISANLERSGLFRPIDRKAFQQRPEDMLLMPRFVDWRQVNAQALVTGNVLFQTDGQIKVEFRLWDVFAEQHMVGLSLSTPRENWRRVAHLVSDAIYRRITGEDGYFDTRIVYIAESGPARARVKRLAIMDQDGENQRFLTDGQHLVLTPRFSPTLQEITYLSYFDDQPRVYIYNIDTGKQELLGNFPGMTFAPRFSPDGNKVIMSMAQDGNSDIHVMDLRTRVVERLTDHPAIETSPSFSPDGSQVTFESDRSGKQQIYVMDGSGDDVHRISFGSGRYATPVWSPRGDWIAFTKSLRGTFFIGVMRPDGSGERLLAQGFLVEGPTWAPNGRVLMFFRETPDRAPSRDKTVRLFTVDITGTNEREVSTGMDASDPAWSPLIP
ncbi:MAG: Tol-Pal system beta propeller repeat protein TolB [Alphaproteobacteria bacterium]|jgi:TolB protein|nr:Tol-Pal system beta propeller repeat protein TolB [Alphaproteobacteria bacterium]